MFAKILYFMDNYVCLGGAAHTLLRQTVLMKNQGKTVCVAVSKYGSGMICKHYLDVCEKENIPVYELDFSVSNQPEGIDIFSVLENYEGVKNFINQQSPDIVHSVQLNPTVELACRELGVPHVMNIYQVVPQFFYLNYVDIFPHYHICDSIYYADIWHQCLGTKSYCVRTVTEKVTKRKRGISTQKIRFVCVGLLCERKNQLEVIKAFEIAINKGITGQLQFWGNSDPSYADKCKKYIDENQLQEHVLINGFSDNMGEIYQSSDVLICGSVSESYPNVISEALANGVIVISVPVAGIPEIIKDRENGYLCKGYFAEDIAEGIFSFWEDIRRGNTYKLMENANDTYEKVHSSNAVSKQLINTYEEILCEYETKGKTSYMIEDLKVEFKNIVDRFLKKKVQFCNSDFVRINLWKIYFVIKNIEKIVSEENKKCYIWGAGKYGQLYKEILEVFAPNIRVEGFIDSYRAGSFLNCSIFTAEMILNSEKSIILVGVLKSKEILQILENHNYKYGIDYFKFEAMAW